MGIIQWGLLVLILLLIVNRLILVKGVTNITAQDAKIKIKDKTVQFIDVRTASEYKANHRVPFKNIPLNVLTDQINKLDKNKEIILICQSGARSARAARILQKRGFAKVLNVKGGINTWN